MDLQSLEIKIARSENLGVLPQIVTSILRLVDNPNSSSKEIERLIERDQAITAKVLRVANSAFYGLSNVGSISRAINQLGMNAVRSLVLGVAFQQVISSKAQAKSFDKLELWKHSLAVAVAARVLGRIMIQSKSEELYCAGIMHDVGLLVLEKFCPWELETALVYARNNDVPLHISEMIVYDTDHAYIGGLLADRWGLSAVISGAIRFHHDPTQDLETAETTDIIALANSIAHSCGFKNNAPVMEGEVDQSLLKRTGITAEQMETFKHLVVQEVERAEAAFVTRSAA